MSHVLNCDFKTDAPCRCCTLKNRHCYIVMIWNWSPSQAKVSSLLNGYSCMIAGCRSETEVLPKQWWRLNIGNHPQYLLKCHIVWYFILFTIGRRTTTFCYIFRKKRGFLRGFLSFLWNNTCYSISSPSFKIVS